MRSYCTGCTFTSIVNIEFCSRYCDFDPYTILTLQVEKKMNRFKFEKSEILHKNWKCIYFVIDRDTKNIIYLGAHFKENDYSTRGKCRYCDLNDTCIPMNVLECSKGTFLKIQRNIDL